MITPAFTSDINVETPPSTFDVARTPDTVRPERQRLDEDGSNRQHAVFVPENREQHKLVGLNLLLPNLITEQHPQNHESKHNFKESSLDDVDTHQRLEEVFGDALERHSLDLPTNGVPADEDTIGFQMMNVADETFNQAFYSPAFETKPGSSSPVHASTDQNFAASFPATTDLQHGCLEASFFSDFLAPGPMLNDQPLDATLELGFPYPYHLEETDLVMHWEELPALNVPVASPDTLSTEVSRRDTSRDHELLSLRQSGLSYREIKMKFGFKEAESTLRGRYRTLTKPKDLRVRKPEWKEDDVSRKLLTETPC